MKLTFQKGIFSLVFLIGDNLYPNILNLAVNPSGSSDDDLNFYTDQKIYVSVIRGLFGSIFPQLLEKPQSFSSATNTTLTDQTLKKLIGVLKKSWTERVEKHEGFFVEGIFNKFLTENRTGASFFGARTVALFDSELEQGSKDRSSLIRILKGLECFLDLQESEFRKIKTPQTFVTATREINAERIAKANSLKKTLRQFYDHKHTLDVLIANLASDEVQQDKKLGEDLLRKFLEKTIPALCQTSENLAKSLPRQHISKIFEEFVKSKGFITPAIKSPNQIPGFDPNAVAAFIQEIEETEDQVSLEVGEDHVPLEVGEDHVPLEVGKDQVPLEVGEDQVNTAPPVTQGGFQHPQVTMSFSKKLFATFSGQSVNISIGPSYTISSNTTKGTLGFQFQLQAGVLVPGSQASLPDGIGSSNIFQLKLGQHSEVLNGGVSFEKGIAGLTLMQVKKNPLLYLVAQQIPTSEARGLSSSSYDAYSVFGIFNHPFAVNSKLSRFSINPEGEDISKTFGLFSLSAGPHCFDLQMNAGWPGKRYPIQLTPSQPFEIPAMLPGELGKGVPVIENMEGNVFEEVLTTSGHVGLFQSLLSKGISLVVVIGVPLIVAGVGLIIEYAAIEILKDLRSEKSVLFLSQRPDLLRLSQIDNEIRFWIGTQKCLRIATKSTRMWGFFLMLLIIGGNVIGQRSIYDKTVFQWTGDLQEIGKKYIQQSPKPIISRVVIIGGLIFPTLFTGVFLIAGVHYLSRVLLKAKIFSSTQVFSDATLGFLMLFVYTSSSYSFQYWLSISSEAGNKLPAKTMLIEGTKTSLRSAFLVVGYAVSPVIIVVSWVKRRIQE